MKAWSVPTARRLAASAVAALSAVTLLGGCGFETRQQAAAIVNGETIHEADVERTAAQLRGAQLEFTENIVVTALIAAPLLHESVRASGSWQPDAVYAQVVASIPDATDTTKEFLSAVALINSEKMTPADVARYRADLKRADISVNPKFGRFVPSEDGPVYFRLGPSQPSWIKSTPGSTAPATTAP